MPDWPEDGRQRFQARAVLDGIVLQDVGPAQDHELDALNQIIRRLRRRDQREGETVSYIAYANQLRGRLPGAIVRLQFRSKPD